MNQKKKIVLIDDNKDYLFTMKTFLEKKGFEVFTAGDGESGLKLVENKKPDIILLDVMMESLFSGFEVYRRLRQHPELKSIPIIGISGMADALNVKFDKKKDFEYFGTEEFLEKPVDKELLMKAIDKLIGPLPYIPPVSVPAPALAPALAPQLYSPALDAQRVIVDFLIALLPVTAMALYLFQWQAAKQILICLATCLIAEIVFTWIRKKPFSIDDCSAAITGIILGLSLPAPAPWYVGVVGSIVAIGIGKIIFSILGKNLFNPAMLGLFSVMVCFAGVMGASGYIDAKGTIDMMTMATPLTAYKQSGIITPYIDLILGTINGSPGEVSAIACLIGGIYLCVRRAASWEIPAGMIGASIFFGGIADIIGIQENWTVLHHLLSGSLLFGAFYVATDPATSPLTPKGKFIFGAGAGSLVMLFRIFSDYPEGVMFSILFMNGMMPLINRWVKQNSPGDLT